MNIYLDVLLILNMAMNSLILWITAWILGVKYRWQKLLLASALGGAYVLVGIIPAMGFLYSPLIKVISSVLIIFVAFGRKPVYTFCMIMGVFYIVSFAMGGAVLGWMHLWQSESVAAYIQQGQMAWQQYKLAHVLGGTCGGIIVLLFIGRRIMTRIAKRKNLFNIIIELDGRSTQVTAMLDTGNELYTLVGHKPVILACHKNLEIIFSDLLKKFLQQYSGDAWVNNLHLCEDRDWLDRIQLIPYHSVGRQSILLGFRPDKVLICGQDLNHAVTDVYIGIYNGVFSGEDVYSALLHPAIIYEQNKEESGICALVGRS